MAKKQTNTNTQKGRTPRRAPGKRTSFQIQDFLWPFRKTKAKKATKNENLKGDLSTDVDKMNILELVEKEPKSIMKKDSKVLESFGEVPCGATGWRGSRLAAGKAKRKVSFIRPKKPEVIYVSTSEESRDARRGDTSSSLMLLKVLKEALKNDTGTRRRAILRR